MRLVVDANIVFALLIKDGLTAPLFFSEDVELYAPEQLLREIRQHRHRIAKKTKRPEVEEFLQEVLRQVTIVPVVVEEPFALDPDDSEYIVLARRLRCPLWTNDKVLSGAVRTVSTAALAELLRKG